MDHIALSILLVTNVMLWIQLKKIRNDVKTIKSWTHQGWECWYDLGTILLKYGLLPPKDSRDQKWNWGDGR